jgi:hypothetical protein
MILRPMNDKGAGFSTRAHTPPLQTSNPPLQTGGFSFCLCQDRLDPALHARAFGTGPMPAAVKIWPPTAARTFFEDPGV